MDMDVYTRRRAKLALMVDQMNQGNIASFARDYGYSRAQISQFLSTTYNGGRSIGERAARTIERKAGSEPGWLDEPLSKGELDLLDGLSTAELRVISDRPIPGDVTPYASAAQFTRIWLNGVLAPMKTGFIDQVSQLNTSPTRYLDFFANADSTVAVQVKGSMLRPRFKNGEYLVFSGRELKPGDDAMVTFSDDRIAILQFLYERDGEKAL